MSNRPPQLSEAIALCKTLMRSGYDAYVINAPLQNNLIVSGKTKDVDIACAADLASVSKIFQHAIPSEDPHIIATLEQDDCVIRIYGVGVEHSAHPEQGLVRITPRLLDILNKDGLTAKFMEHRHNDEDPLACFESLDNGYVQFEGLAIQTLRRNYLLGIRALRLSANHDLPIEPNTWFAILQAVSRILDYVPFKEIMQEWREVQPVAMHKFLRLLNSAHILHRLMPEIAALSGVYEPKDDDGAMHTVLENTFERVRYYPRDEFENDWLGTMAVVFSDVGKLYTGECTNDTWTFYQHHRVGASVARKILRRLQFVDEDIDTICNLVRNQVYFQFMMTDKGLRRFNEIDDNMRLINISRADIDARGLSKTKYNHNCKYLERAQTDEIMLEPLLNGNEIMEYTGLTQGQSVGIIRESLLQAQIEGKVTDRDAAIEFVKNYKV